MKVDRTGSGEDTMAFLLCFDLGMVSSCEDASGVGRNVSEILAFLLGLCEGLMVTAAARDLVAAGWLFEAGDDAGNGVKLSCVCFALVLGIL